MRITFKTSYSVPETMPFEDIFEEELRLSIDEKMTLLSKSESGLWMLVDGELAGETYGIRLNKMDEQIEDCENEEKLTTIYCYSTALLPKFRGKGLGPILKAYWLGMLAKDDFTNRVVGHATSDQAAKLNLMFGAQFSVAHKNWYGTERTAHFYWINL